MRDKNGTKIKDLDLVRVRHKYGEDGTEHQGIYRVHLNPYRGMLLTVISDQENIAVHGFSWEGKTLTSYYHGYDGEERLSIPDTWGENRMKRTRWKELHASKDIEVIKEQAENP